VKRFEKCSFSPHPSCHGEPARITGMCNFCHKLLLFLPILNSRHFSGQNRFDCNNMNLNSKHQDLPSLHAFCFSQGHLAKSPVPAKAGSGKDAGPNTPGSHANNGDVD
jgi:hypothetical protein